MKKLYTILLLVAAMFVASNVSATDTTNAKLTAKADSAINSAATDVALVNQGLQLTHVNFGKATGVKDSIVAILEALPHDSASQSIKKQGIDLLEQGLAAKKAGQSFWNQGTVEAILALLIALISFLSGHFRIFIPKKS